MVTIRHYRRSIWEAVTGQSYTCTELIFRNRFTAGLFQFWIKVFGPGRDYEYTEAA